MGEAGSEEGPEGVECQSVSGCLVREDEEQGSRFLKKSLDKLFSVLRKPCGRSSSESLPVSNCDGTYLVPFSLLDCLASKAQ